MAQDDLPQQKQRSTSALVAIGAAWFMFMRWALRFIGLISTVVLARVLVPSDFGLVAIASSYAILLDAITDIGARSAVIRYDNGGRKFLDTVFTLQMLRGFLLAGMVALSSLVIRYTNMDQRLGPVIL